MFDLMDLNLPFINLGVCEPSRSIENFFFSAFFFSNI